MSSFSLLQLSKEGITSLFVQGLAVSFGIALHFLLANQLGAAEYGEYSYAYSLLILGAMFCKFGFDSTSLRYLPEYLSSNELSLGRGLVTFSMIMIVSLSILCGGIFYLSNYLIPASLIKNQLLLALFVTLPFLSLLQYFQFFLRGCHKVIAAQFPEPILRPFIIGVAILIAGNFAGRELNGETALWYNAFATVIALIICLWLCRAQLQTIFAYSVRYAYQKWFRASFTFFIITGLGLIISQIDLLIVGSMLTPEETGIFSAALKISSILLIGNYAVNTCVAPKVAKYFSESKISELKQLGIASSKLIFLFAFVVSCLVWVFKDLILSALGAEYLLAGSFLGWLLGVELVRAFFGSAGFLLSMTDRAKVAAWFLAFALLINITLDLILIPKWGLEGAAIGSFLTMVIHSSATSIVIKKAFGIWSTPLG